MVMEFISSFIRGFVPRNSDGQESQESTEDSSPQEESIGSVEFDGDREEGVGVVTAFEEELGLGCLDGRYRFDISHLPKLSIPLEEGLQLNYTAVHSPTSGQWEIVDWKIVPGKIVPIQQTRIEEEKQLSDLTNPLTKMSSPKPNIFSGRKMSGNCGNSQNGAGSSKCTKIQNGLEPKILSFKKLSVQVVSIGPKYFVVQQSNNSLRFKVDASLFPEWHLLFKGDWIDVCVEYESGQFQQGLEVQQSDTVVSASWTEKSTLVGTITRRGCHYCINDEIYCTDKQLNRPSYRLGLNDRCKVTYVRSDQTKENVDPEGKCNPNLSSRFFKRSLTVFPVTEAEEKKFFDEDDIFNQSKQLEELCQNKQNVVINPDHLNFGAKKVNTIIESKFEIINNGSSRIVLHSASLHNDQNVCQFTLQVRNSEGKDGLTVIDPGSTTTVAVKCIPKLLGKTREICLFNFGAFKIARKISIWSRMDDADKIFPTSSAWDADLKSNKLRKQKREQRFQEEIKTLGKLLKELEPSNIIKGPVPVRHAFFSADKTNRLPGYNIPPEITQIFVQQQMPHKDGRPSERDGGHSLLNSRYPDVDWFTLTFENYLERFHVAIHLEELELIKLWKHLDLTGVKITVNPDGNCNTMIIPVSESLMSMGKCPLQIGDRLRCSYCPDPNPTEPQKETEDIKIEPEPGVKEDSNSTNSDEEADDNSTKSVEKLQDWYEGYIYDMSSGVIYAKFNKDFMRNHQQDLPVNVNFQQKRNNFRRLCHGVVLAKEYLGKDWLFPQEDGNQVKTPKINFIEDDKPAPRKIMVNDSTDGASNVNFAPIRAQELLEHKQKMVDSRAASTFPEKVPNIPIQDSTTQVTLKWFNQTLNPQQKDAVRRILRGQCRPLPYIIFGPPGTGKSMTMVEAIMQVNALDPHSRILASCPSNQSADILAERLVDSGRYSPGEFVRLNGFLRNPLTIPNKILRYCADGDKLNAIINHKIIICTISSAAQFFQLNIDPQRFTHVFVDEAGYSTEPETLIACVMSVSSKQGQIILAGDPNQLEPVLYHHSEVHKILRRSLLDRFMKTPLYSHNSEKYPLDLYNPLYVTMLTKSYRLHPILVKLPSDRFYLGHLESGNCTDEELLDKLWIGNGDLEREMSYFRRRDSFNFVLKRNIPMIFHGVESPSYKEDGTKSWYNLDEARQCCEYVIKLLDAGVKSEDIGIISLYRKQVEVIREGLRQTRSFDNKTMPMPTVSTIQGFQGGERRVIIISTVVSIFNESLSRTGIQLRGFLYSPKMFNVTVTRAKSLMIVVGDPSTLQQSKDWDALLRYAVELGVYTGCNLPLGVKVDDYQVESTISIKSQPKDESNHSQKFNQVFPAEAIESTQNDDEDEEEEEEETFSPFD